MRRQAPECKISVCIHKKSVAARQLIFVFRSYFSACKLDDKVYIVGLYFCLVSGLISVYLAAFGAFMKNYISLFGVCNGFYGAHDTVALTGSVPGIHVNVEGAETFGAMVSGGIAEGLYLETAVCAHKTVIVFCKKFTFHISLSLNCEM